MSVLLPLPTRRCYILVAARRLNAAISVSEPPRASARRELAISARNKPRARVWALARRMQGVARARRVARSWPAPTAQCSWRRRRCRCERRSSDELPAGLNLQRGRLLSSLCTWRCGGPARLFAEASSAAQLQRLLLWARSARVATVVIGRGSNCLFDDNGFNGLVILNAVRGLAVTQTEPGRCLCTLGAGTHLYVAAVRSRGRPSLPREFSERGGPADSVHRAALQARTAVLGWGGLGWAAAIPGTVGGAVAGNAGADGADMASMLQSVTVVTADGVQARCCRLPRARAVPRPCASPRSVRSQELPVNGGSADGWGYRQSPFQRLPCGSVAIASATVRLQLDPHARERLVRAHRAVRALRWGAYDCCSFIPAACTPARAARGPAAPHAHSASRQRFRRKRVPQPAGWRQRRPPHRCGWAEGRAARWRRGEHAARELHCNGRRSTVSGHQCIDRGCAGARGRTHGHRAAGGSGADTVRRLCATKTVMRSVPARQQLTRNSPSKRLVGGQQLLRARACNIIP